MNFRSPVKPASINIDLTPLINIVFLMLIFFMLAGTLKPGDDIQPAELDDASAIEHDSLVIVMALDGALSVRGQSVEWRELAVLLDKNEATSGKVAIKPDSRLAAEQLVLMTQQLRARGITEVTLIVESP